jgi:hypothetical protein
MLELPIKDVRLPRLHLPKIKRDAIGRSLSDRLPNVELPDAASNFAWPKIDLPSVDVGQALAGTAAAAHIGRRRHRPRWPLAVGGLIVAGVVGWAILSHEALRARLARRADAMRARLSALRSSRYDQFDLDRDDPIAFDAAETAPVQAPAFAASTAVAASGYPAGLGSKSRDGDPASEEAGRPT